MTDTDKALQTQLKNIQTKTGKTLDQLYAWLDGTGLEKHGQLRDAAKRDLGLGHGDANTLVTIYRQSTGAATAPAASADDAVDQLYQGPKAPLRPVHELVMTGVHSTRPFSSRIVPKASQA